MNLIPLEAGAFLSWLSETSLKASLLILLVLVTQWLLRDHLTPKWRYALWLLVVIRLVLPDSVNSDLSLYNWMRAEVNLAPAGSVGEEQFREAGFGAGADQTQAETAPVPQSSLSAWLGTIWALGATGLLGYLVWSTVRLSLRIRPERPVTESAVLNLLEDCKQTMGVTTPLLVIETAAVKCPALLGFIRPRLLLPKGLLNNFSLSELRYVFCHELGHIKRGDIPLGWLMTVPLMLHWFNPLLWYALSRMRADGEVACDALALSYMGGAENRSYGETIIKLLENFARPAVAPAMVGILENTNQMKRRLNMIARFRKNSSLPVVSASLFAALAVVTLTDAQPAQPRPGSNSAAAPARSGPPKIVKTSPEVGATDVDPATKEIIVTFDRDMAGGFSWTGGGPEFPPSPEGKKAQWRDKRTCVLPVKLEAASYYRVGINSTSYQNFKSAEGVPAQTSAIYFTTKGASEALKRKATRPMIVEIVPRNGATDVDPNLKELRVTFNVPMGAGFSWTGGGPEFPTIPNGKKPSWTADKKTCVLPVQLQPNSSYKLGLNSPSHKNFQSQGGVPLDPVIYGFRTRAE